MPFTPEHMQLARHVAAFATQPGRAQSITSIMGLALHAGRIEIRAAASKWLNVNCNVKIIEEQGAGDATSSEAEGIC